MSFKKVIPYKKNLDNRVALVCAPGRHGTLKLTIEIGRDVLEEMGWVAGYHVDVEVGTEEDAGTIMLTRGTSYKIRARFGDRGTVVIPAAEWNEDAREFVKSDVFFTMAVDRLEITP